MPGTYAPPAVELPKTSAIVGMPIADSSVRSWKIRPAGTNRSDWVGRSAPPDSTRLMTGSRLRRAISRARRFLRSVYGFIDPPRTVGSWRDQHALDPGHHADAGDDARADHELGPPRGQGGQLEQRRVPVDQELDALPGEQPAPVTVPLRVFRAAARAGQLELLVQGGDGRQLPSAVGQVRLAGRVHRRSQDRHAAPFGRVLGRVPIRVPICELRLTAIHFRRQAGQPDSGWAFSSGNAMPTVTTVVNGKSLSWSQATTSFARSPVGEDVSGDGRGLHCD